MRELQELESGTLCCIFLLRLIQLTERANR
jgi:hypothetical protein